MTSRILLVACCGALFGASSLSAQQAALRPRPSALFVAPVAVADTTAPSGTYWRTGALVVGIPSALFGGALGIGLCGLDDSSGGSGCAGPAIGMALLFGGMGAVVGALIGGQFHRPD